MPIITGHETWRSTTFIFGQAIRGVRKRGPAIECKAFRQERHVPPNRIRTRCLTSRSTSAVILLSPVCPQVDATPPYYGVDTQYLPTCATTSLWPRGCADPVAVQCSFVVCPLRIWIHHPVQSPSFCRSKSYIFTFCDIVPSLLRWNTFGRKTKVLHTESDGDDIGCRNGNSWILQQIKRGVGPLLVLEDPWKIYYRLEMQVVGCKRRTGKANPLAYDLVVCLHR